MIFLIFYPEIASLTPDLCEDPLGSPISLDHRSDTTNSIRDPMGSEIQSQTLPRDPVDPRSTVKLHHGILLDHGSNTADSREISWDHRSDFGSMDMSAYGSVCLLCAVYVCMLGQWGMRQLPNPSRSSVGRASYPQPAPGQARARDASALDI